LCASRTDRANRTLGARSAVGAGGTLWTGRASGTLGTVRACGTSVACDARLATEKHEEIESCVRRDARGDRRREGADHVIFQHDNFGTTYANAAHRDAVHYSARVLDLTYDRTVRAARLGDNTDRLVSAVERRHHRREAIAFGIRDRDDDARVDAIDHRARDVANQTAVADPSGAARAIHDDRIARVFEDERHGALRERSRR
jgi:hypothetical protein